CKDAAALGRDVESLGNRGAAHCLEDDAGHACRRKLELGRGHSRGVQATALSGAAPERGEPEGEEPHLDGSPGLHPLQKMVMLPILLLPFSTNQTLPSGPAVMPLGAALRVGMANSVTVPLGVTRATLFPTSSVNHTLPSGPATIS